MLAGKDNEALPHDTPLITTLVAGFGLAFLFGLLAQRLKLPLIAGYLLAGVVIGPFTPGYVADSELAAELAEVGVILLMFGVGLHFSPRDLMAVKAIAVPGDRPDRGRPPPSAPRWAGPWVGASAPR